jgi:hypothetical protein
VKKLPKLPGLRPRKSQSGQVYYYLKTDPALREVPLGKNVQQALVAWRRYRIDLYAKETKLSGVLKLIDCFRVVEIPLRDAKTQMKLLKQVTALEKYFLNLGKSGLNTSMLDARSYLEHRGAKFSVRAGGEVRLLIHIWTWAGRHSIIAAPCPWTSDAVTDERRSDAQTEIGDALRYYAHHHANAPSWILQCLAAAPASAPQITDSDLLTWARVVSLLMPPVECGFERGRLILGTRRSPQLKAHRRTLSDHKRKAERQSPDGLSDAE